MIARQHKGVREATRPKRNIISGNVSLFGWPSLFVRVTGAVCRDFAGNPEYGPCERSGNAFGQAPIA